MRVGRIAFLLFVCTNLQAAGAVATSTAGVTLEECYERARTISETLGISQENIHTVEAEYRDKLGDVLPHVDWIKSQFYQDKASPSGGANTTSTFLTTQPLSYFQLTQPLFAGFRDWFAVSILKSMKVQSQFDEKETELQLLSDVAAAFYIGLAQHEQLTTLQETLKLTADRLPELEHWVKVGRSLPSDLLNSQTQVATLNAQIEDAKRTEKEARELLRYLTGVAPDVPLADERPDPTPVAMDVALQRSAKRPDLMSGEEAVHQAHLNVKYAKGSYLPTLGLLARSYTERIGFESDIRWDATFTLDVPLLAGGSHHAQVQEARSQDIIAELAFSRLKRSVERIVRVAQEDLEASISVAQAYEKAATMGEKNYQAQLKEYRLGRTTNQDVLQILTNLQDVKHQWVTSKYTSKLDDVQMRVAMGEGL